MEKYTLVSLYEGIMDDYAELDMDPKTAARDGLIYFAYLYNDSVNRQVKVDPEEQDTDIAWLAKELSVSPQDLVWLTWYLGRCSLSSVEELNQPPDVQGKEVVSCYRWDDEVYRGKVTGVLIKGTLA